MGHEAVERAIRLCRFWRRPTPAESCCRAWRDNQGYMSDTANWLPEDAHRGLGVLRLELAALQGQSSEVAP